MTVSGVHDGHDAETTLIRGENVLAALQERDAHDG